VRETRLFFVTRKGGLGAEKETKLDQWIGLRLAMRDGGLEMEV